MEQQYEDEQSMEIEALESIFMDDLRGRCICFAMIDQSTIIYMNQCMQLYPRGLDL